MTNELIINPIGGLANRMRSIASGISLAEKMNIDHKIVWPLTDELKCGFDLLFHNARIIKCLDQVSSFRDLCIYDIPRKKNLYMANLLQWKKWDRKLTDDMLPEFIDNPSALEEIIENGNGRIIIRSGLSYYPFSDDLYRSLFTPHDIILKDARNRLGEKKENFVGLHIRRTDNATSIIYSPLHLFTEAMDKEIDEDNKVMFYLATDDDRIKRQLKNAYGDRVIFSNLTADRKTPSGIKEALTELLTLSMCRKIYGSYWRSFSEASAIIGRNPFHKLRLTK